MNKINIIYVLGLARSGSTYLSKFLTEVLGAISLGEIIKTIEIFSDKDELKSYRSEERKCTCGKAPEDCEFWGKLLCNIENDEKILAHYKVIKAAQEKYPNSIIIDTSKKRYRFSDYYINNKEIANLDFKIIIINIVRHYAGQIASYQKYHTKEKKKGIRATILADAYYWLNKNYKNISFLEKSNFPVKTIMYEDLIFRSQETKNEIESFVNSSFKTYEKIQPLMHEMVGNESFKTTNFQGIIYDTSWMYEKRIAYLSPLLAPVIFYNKKWHDKYQPKKN
ncbi:MAG: hypothetical protein ACYSWS_06415 [Planctomycetota bacterium]|jgi:hypothetical protein